MARLAISFKSALDVTASVALIAAASFVIWSGTRQPPEPPSLTLDWPTDVALGATTATVGLMMFSDFECPYCAKFATETLPGLLESYVHKGQVQLAFRHLPLEIHPNANKVARWAACAQRKGKFWEAHDFLFERSSTLGLLDLTTFEAQLALSGGDFFQCTESTETEKQIQADLTEAGALGIRATPTFLFGKIESAGRFVVSERFSGAAPVQRFRAAIEKVE